jgi:uncharacterized protein YndB with AHSA1/START domain
MNAATDRIEKQIVLKAPRARVWQALTTAEKFGEWFGVELQGKTFTVGQRVQGAKANCSGESVKGDYFNALIERIDPEQYFAYRWHPYAADKSTDLSNEPETLVEFELKETAEGTLLQVVESGFDRLTAARRTESYPMHTGGWEHQLKSIESYLA